MIIDSVEVGRVSCNCYVVGCEKTGEGIIIDAGGDADLINEIVGKHKLNIKNIFCTHAHFDHVEGLNDLLKYLTAPILLHEDDLELYNNLPSQAGLFCLEAEPAPFVNHRLKGNEIIRFGDYSLKVIHTPGHSPGSISLQCNNVIFTGDTIFAGSIGRTDLPGGSYDQLIKAAKENIMIFDDNVKLFPGHGPSTTVGHEKKYNPFLTR